MKSSHKDLIHYTSKCFVADGPVTKTQCLKNILHF